MARPPQNKESTTKVVPPAGIGLETKVLLGVLAASWTLIFGMGGWWVVTVWSRLDTLNTTMSDVKIQLTVLNNKVDALSGKVVGASDSAQMQFASLDKRLDEVVSRFDGIDRQLERIAASRLSAVPTATRSTVARIDATATPLPPVTAMTIAATVTMRPTGFPPAPMNGRLIPGPSRGQPWP